MITITSIKNGRSIPDRRNACHVNNHPYIPRSTATTKTADTERER
jgi:hypothetical protein